MGLDDGRTVDGRGEAHQSSLRSNATSRGLNNLNGSVKGIVLRTYTADDPENRLSSNFTDRHGFGAVCDVLVLNDGKSSTYWPLSGVMILPSQPSGLDNFEEALPRGSSKYINGEDYDATLSEADVNDLDGDWVVVSFIGGNVNAPYISNYYPSPRNTYDTQTGGKGHPNSQGEGQALQQRTQGRGRYFRRINGVEHVVNEQGDIFLSTHYANGDLTPNAKRSTTDGRFSREVQPGAGGGIRLNMKTTQPLELNWNEQEDGIGLNSVHDPALPQTNPQQTTPYSEGKRTATFIRVQNQTVSFEVPGLFSVQSQNSFRLESLADSDILVGTRFGVDVGDVYDVTVGNDYTLTSKEGSIFGISDLGNISFTATEAEFLVTAKEDVTLTSQEGDIVLAAEAANISLTAAASVNLAATLSVNLEALKITLGSTTALAVQPVILGTLFQVSQTTLWGAIAALAAAIVVDPVLSLPPSAATKTAATAVVNAVAPYLIPVTGTLATQLSGTVFVGP